MKAYAQKNFKRLKSLDAIIIILCDLATIPLFILLGYLALSFFQRITGLLSKVIVSQQLMMSNPSIVQLNLSLFEKAELYGFTGIGIIIILFSVGYSVLNYVQWSRVVKKSFDKTIALRFCLIESLWFILALVVSVLLFSYVLDPVDLLISLPLTLFVITHVSLGLHIGLLTQHKGLLKKQPWSVYLKTGFSPVFSNSWQWFCSYALFIVIMLVVGFISSLLSSIIPALSFLSAVLFLLALCWWRMMVYSLVR